mgnify:FL=1
MNYTQNETEKRKVEQYFSRKKINPEDIQSFCFMQNYKFRVGPSILILQLRSGKTKMLRPNKTGTEVLHYLLDKQIPFSNYTPQAKQAVTVPEKSYWSIWNILFDVFCVAVLLVLGYMMLKVFLEEPSSEYLAKNIAKYFALLIYMICFPIVSYYLFYKCHSIRTGHEGLVLSNRFSKRVLPYDGIRKLNFCIFSSKQPRVFIELIDKDFCYHRYLLGWMPLKSAKELALLLQSLGIDATDSINQ